MSRVLVVDDEESIRFSLKHFLSEDGHDVETAVHVVDAKSILGANQFDVAVIDRLLMDGGNGLELIEYINDRQPDCATIMMSAYPNFVSASETMKFETFAYLTKPIKKKQILQVVSEATIKTKEKKKTAHYDKVLESIFNSSENGILVHDLTGKIRFINPSFLRVFGRKPENLQGRYIFDIFPDYGKERVQSEITELSAGRSLQELEGTVKREDGQKVYFTLSRSVCTDRDNNVTDILAVVRDITEKRKMEKQIRHMQNMETVGIISTGIAHDINNILMMIYAHSELALDELPGESPAREDVETIFTSAKRANELTNKLLTFSRKIEDKLKPVRLQPVAEEAIKLVRATIHDSIQLKCDIDPACGTVMADPVRMHQVLMNLCVNAIHSIQDDRGVLEIKMTEEDDNADLPGTPDSLTTGRSVKITVKDSGLGMDEKTMARIYEPFFSTRPAGGGTGMGLSVVLDIVKSHKGLITVDSEPGNGTEFNIYIPRVDAEPEKEEIEPVIGGEEHLLLVDNDEDVSNALQTMLERLGYRVTSQTSSVDALGTFRAHSHDFDIVVLNHHMPRMSGIELAEKVREIKPDMPVILITGSGNEIMEDKNVKKIIDKCVLKPFASHDIDRAIQNVVKTGAGVFQHTAPG